MGVLALFFFWFFGLTRILMDITYCCGVNQITSMNILQNNLGVIHIESTRVIIYNWTKNNNKSMSLINDISNILVINGNEDQYVRYTDNRGEHVLLKSISLASINQWFAENLLTEIKIENFFYASALKSHYSSAVAEQDMC